MIRATGIVFMFVGFWLAVVAAINLVVALFDTGDLKFWISATGLGCLLALIGFVFVAMAARSKRAH